MPPQEPKTLHGRLHRSFALVLAGGGARGYAHAGVLRTLERYGYHPSAVVGVSMGAVVGTAWAARPDWYETLLALDTGMFPGPVGHDRGRPSILERVRRTWSFARTAEDLLFSWGPGTRALEEGKAFLQALIGPRRLEDLAVPVAVCATDLRSGGRVVLRSGDATTAVYASAALAGVLPPLPHERGLLADGAYSDVAPIDVARAMDVDHVLAVDPGQLMPDPVIGNGLQAMLRAVEICHRKHSDLRFEEADLVLRPRFRRTVDTLDFEARRECVAAGIREVRGVKDRLRALLGPGAARAGDGTGPHASEGAGHHHVERMMRDAEVGTVRLLAPGGRARGGHGPTRSLFGVAGMDCAECTERVRSALTAVEGVLEVDARRGSALVEVRHDGTRVGVAELVATIRRAAEGTSFDYRPVPMRARWRTEGR